jgi:hypothetical protein
MNTIDIVGNIDIDRKVYVLNRKVIIYFLILLIS